MKLLKKILAMTLGAALLCPITAYASPEDDARNLLQQVMEQEAAVNDMNAFYDFNIGVSGPALDEMEIGPVNMRLEMNAKMNGITDPAQMKYMIYMRLTGPDGEQMTGTNYYVGGYSYSDTMGMKTKVRMPLQETMTNALAMTSANEFAMEMIRDVSLRPEGQNRVICYTMDSIKLNQYVQDVMAAAGVGELLDGFTFSIGSAKGEYVINPAGQCEKMRMSMIMDMGMDGEELRITMDGDIGIADPGQPVEVPLPNPAEYVEIAAY